MMNLTLVKTKTENKLSKFVTNRLVIAWSFVLREGDTLDSLMKIIQLLVQTSTLNINFELHKNHLFTEFCILPQNGTSSNF